MRSHLYCLLSLAFALSASAVPFDIQAAIDASPGGLIEVPDGEHHVSAPVRITAAGTVLSGHGAILQDDPAQPVLVVDHADGARIEGVTFGRAEGKQEATANGVVITNCDGVTLSGVRVMNCKARDSALRILECSNVSVRDCEIVNYKRIAIDDRTDNPEHYGYAFHAIDGTGLGLEHSTGVTVTNCRIVEHDLLPTPEVKEKYNLGSLTEGKRPSVQGDLAAEAFRSGYVNNWHQGSAVIVSRCENVTLTGNYLLNCAQGIDIHSDFVVVANNTVDCGMMGVKATHGARNILISGNMLRRIDLWGVLLNPGTASWHATDATDSEPAREANVDGGTVITGNIITDFGYGNEYWNWGGKHNGRGSFPIALYEGQLDTNPPLHDVVIDGNVVYDTGRDKIIRDGKAVYEPPHYQYAIYIGPWGGGDPGPTYPQHIVIGDNVLHPGTDGVSNIDLAEFTE